MTILILLDSFLVLYLMTYIAYTYFIVVANFVLKDINKAASDIIHRLAIVIPAHNEELYIARLLESIERQSYPADAYSIFVIADNCSDSTADIVRKMNHQVLIRNNSIEIGKGYAIKFAIEIIPLEEYDAIFIVDADSMLGVSAFDNLNNLLSSGANIIQCYNGVANPSATWFTRVMDVARSIGNEIIEPGKQKLGLTSHLMGNGMCFHVRIIQVYGWDSFSIGEDWEYYSKLIKNGESIYFAHGSKVLHQESINIKDATQQRIRWSSGRFSIIWKYGIPIFISGLSDKSIKKIDASLVLLFPNPSLGINLTLLSLILSLLTFNRTFTVAVLPIICIIILLQLLLFILGALKTENKFENILSIFFSPIFLIWKMAIDAISFLGYGRKKWVRGTRR